MSVASMPELQFDHVGMIVADLHMGRHFLQTALNITLWTEIVDDPGLGVSVQFGVAAQGPAYELITPLGDASPIASALRAGKNILNHVAYLTSDLTASATHLREQACYPAGEAQPAIAYAGSRVQFFVSPLRFLIELIEAPGHRHVFAAAATELEVLPTLQPREASR